MLKNAALQDRDVDRARVLLDEAIIAAGGAEALARHAAFAWHGAAIIYAGDREIRIEGDWQVEPPDKSKVETFEIDKGPGSMRTMMIDGSRGWSVVEGKDQPLPDAILANERDQFYLYYVLRLEPLRRDGSTLAYIDPDSNGRPGLRVTRAGRPEVELFFTAATRRVEKLVAHITDPVSGGVVEEELNFTGTIESNGVRWFNGVAILQNHRRFFVLKLATFQALPKLDFSR
jgi:hypothetical protein